MADRSHLTAVRTTDKRGRATTVYRNVQGRPTAPGAAAIPAPSAAPGRVARPRTPMPQVAERSAEEIAAFLGEPRRMFEPLAVSHGWLKDTRIGREAISLAIDLTEHGDLTQEDASAALATAVPRGPEGLPIDILRMAARLRPFKAECTDSLWVYEVIASVCGQYDKAKEPRQYRVATEEEFASAAAVARFTLRFGCNEDRVTHGGMDLSGEGDLVNSQRLRNPHLERLIARNPDDVGRIIDYVNERGMHTSRKKDVDELRDWLHSDGAPAVSDGWL